MRFRPLAVLASLLVVAGAPDRAALAQTAQPVTVETPDDLFRSIDAFFERNPELKTTPGSGWKPYNRAKWFHQRRMDGGQLPAPDARWKAYEIRQARELELGPGTRASWFSLGPSNFGGRMLSIDFDASNTSTVYVGAAGGGLWKSTDSGATWTPMTDGLPSLAVGGVAVSRTDPNVVVIGTGEPTFNIDRVTGVGILRSTDAGVTWNTTNISYTSGQGHGFHVITAGASGVFVEIARLPGHCGSRKRTVAPAPCGSSTAAKPCIVRPRAEQSLCSLISKRLLRTQSRVLPPHASGLPLRSIAAPASSTASAKL
jgi:hypothetical protein